MPDPARTLELTLALHLEGDASAAEQQVAALDEVASVSDVQSSQSRMDASTITSTLMLVTTIAGSAATLTATFDTLVENLKKLRTTLGLHKASVEVGRKTVDLDDLTPDQKKQLLEQALAAVGPAPTPSSTVGAPPT